jgi:hypothetical protein
MTSGLKADDAAPRRFTPPWTIEERTESFIVANRR